ncbi:hypothetical protein BO99DRAFT_341048 [Aspergillus violaceofuscus CBS 115571]|uniref:Thymidylate kinase n=1 Tax=Aspergillus violaceofuscus (strain CBS 115571) TaxID=1450538 RepID=A0A2V5HW37_ASPV1|nr:hypothetical protein BO99DRAFT_427487 [Aspergillus violaceofuscus CBS 115571]PYI16087.1 hypothetical protein BO99DRAFT_341048 [Aspergillus violaceofuscus CBS 115571]
MAALTMTPTAVRQPFASLDAPRMRSLLRSKLNLKNKQDGAILSKKTQPTVDVDSENIDPVTLKLSTKRKRTMDDDDFEPAIKISSKPSKTSRVVLTTLEPSSAPRMPATPTKPILSTPKSAPILKPAGRSPQPKSCKSSSRRSTIAKSRLDSTGRKSVHRPFSLAAALSGPKPKRQSNPKAPASWAFDIYVDNEQEEMTNLMQHSTCVLDINDQEGKAETSGRGKENVPPVELGLDLPRSREQESPAAAARKSVMMEESREPLGDLNAADFYGDDCHAFSYVVIYDEEETDGAEKKAPVHPLSRTSPRSIPSKLSSVSTISSLLEASLPAEAITDAKPEPTEAEIEIWESASAAEEAAEADEAAAESFVSA